MSRCCSGTGVVFVFSAMGPAGLTTTPCSLCDHQLFREAIDCPLCLAQTR